MEVIEDGNIMDRIPILLQRDLEYYQQNQTVLSEKICRGVVGGRLDFPRNASFASVKIVLWLEEEFSIAFKQGSGMFVMTEEDENADGGVAKTSDPDKFVQLAVKSSDYLLEHLHMLTQEALDHTDLPVLTAALGAAALLKNSLYCYVHHVEDMGNAERHSLLQSCYKRYVTMSEAVGERVLDLHNRVLSLYILQDSGGRPIDEQRAVQESSPSVHGWWLYMNGSKRDLWDTVPPRMAQRIFAGMLNETLTILTVRYCQSGEFRQAIYSCGWEKYPSNKVRQTVLLMLTRATRPLGISTVFYNISLDTFSTTKTSEATTPVLLNDILNILLCVAELLPSIATSGGELAGLRVRRATRDVRDVHAKCNQLFQCLVYRGAEPHYIQQAFNEFEEPLAALKDAPQPWFTFVSPKLFGTSVDEVTAKSTQELELKTALGLELVVLLAQPQPSWHLLVKVLMMRNCHLSRLLLIRAIRHMSLSHSRWPARGLWYCVERDSKCGGFLCTADGYCKFKEDADPGEEYARAAGAMTYLIATIGSKAELKSTLCYALEISGREWAACLDKRQVWCDRRPAWLAGLLAMVGSALQFIPSMLVNAVQTGASMYQTMSLCLTCISRSLDCIPRPFLNACSLLERSLPAHIRPCGGSVLLQLLTTVAYEELQTWARKEASREKAATSTSVSFDGSLSAPSAVALAIAEAICSIDEDHKHTQQIERIVAQSNKTFKLSGKFGLEDFPEFAELFEEGDVPGSNAERASDAAVITSQVLMTSAGRDSLRVLYEHLKQHASYISKELGVCEESEDAVSLDRVPLLYTMFHIGRKPFDQFLRAEWVTAWSALARACAARWARPANTQ